MAITIRNYARELDSGSWEEQFNVDKDASDDIAIVMGQTVGDNRGNVTIVDAVYNGTGEITTTKYDGFPVGSTIRDVTNGKLYFKTGATTWKVLSFTDPS